jgi:hypothetical protein
MNHHQLNHARELMDKLNRAVADYESFAAGVNQQYTTPQITLYNHGTKIYEFKISREQASAIIVDEKNRLKEKMEKAKKDFEDYMPT